MQGGKTMYDPRNDKETATRAQMEHLRQLGLDIQRSIGWSLAEELIKHQSATSRQLGCLEKFGMKPDGPMRRFDAHRLISQEVNDRRRFPATPRQEMFLRARGRWRDGMMRGEAYDLIKWIKSSWTEERCGT